MAKYEIMIIVDPKADLKVAKDIVNDIFDNPKFEKLERTELAYEINNSKTAQYVLVETEANGEQIKEFTRKVNISKEIWRNLVINLDTEMGTDKSASIIGPPEPRRPRRTFDNKDDSEKNQINKSEKPKAEEK